MLPSWDIGRMLDQIMSASKPPFYRQETRYSCAPACLRMVLGAFGVHADEEQLRHLTDCSPLGTDAFQLIEAARQFGLTASRTYTLASLEELTSVITVQSECAGTNVPTRPRRSDREKRADPPLSTGRTFCTFPTMRKCGERQARSGPCSTTSIDLRGGGVLRIKQGIPRTIGNTATRQGRHDLIA
jgi:hypothetical protein